MAHILEHLTKGNSECDLQSLDPSRLLGLLDYVELHIGLGGQPIALPTSLLAEPPDVVSFLKHYVRDMKFKNGERVSYFAIRVAIGRPHQSIYCEYWVYFNTATLLPSKKMTMAFFLLDSSPAASAIEDTRSQRATLHGKPLGNLRWFLWPWAATFAKTQRAPKISSRLLPD